MENWINNDFYLVENIVNEDAPLKQALEATRENNLPGMEVSPAHGKFLYLLAKIKNAKRILELGTFCGYSTIWLAKAVADGGIVVTMECVDAYADIARKNIDNAGLLNNVQLMRGDAAELMEKLINEKEEPFDLIFIDADKLNYPQYLELSLGLSKTGTIIYGDNVLRGGKLCDVDNPDSKGSGVRKFIENLGRTQTLESTVLQTVGVKGYDGFSLSIVK
ncbi:MAG: O-methyltransferase [Firmicutes bacterium]|nr:O-methyltransferase [Bacillota bacterium]